MFNISWQLTQATTGAISSLLLIFDSCTQPCLVVTGKVSLDRVDAFLKETELLDEFVEKFTADEVTAIVARPGEDKDIGFRNASFSWTGKPTDGTLTPSRRAYRLRVEGEVKFKRDCLNLIIGPT